MPSGMPIRYESSEESATIKTVSCKPVSNIVRICESKLTVLHLLQIDAVLPEIVDDFHRIRLVLG